MDMTRYPCRSRALTVAVLTAGIVSLPGRQADASGTASPSDGTETAPIQRPAALRGDDEREAPSDAPPSDPGDGSAIPDAPIEAAGETPSNSMAPDTTGAASVAQPTEPTGGAKNDTVSPELLETHEEAVTPRPPPPVVTADPAGDPPLSLTASHDDEYRPAHNPGRLNVGMRVLFANAGGPKEIGGRLGGFQLDLGQAFNNFGYGVTASAWGGRIVLPRETGAEMNAMFGAGPTISLGRRALVGRGYLDLQLGYDFFYGVVNRRRDNPAVVAPSDPDVVLEQAENLAPHGPRATLDMGLLIHAPHRRYFHGIGVSMGYQGLIGSFRGELPFTHMLTLGFSYWMG